MGAQLPSDCRPKGRLIFNMNNHGKTARVDVTTDGKIYWVAGGRDHSWISITGIVIDRIQGRCSNGTWLRVCGGSGGGESQKAGVWGAHKMYVRTGALVDQFNGRGGNGGGAHWLDCGSGFKITGYQLRCGSLVDKVRFQCKNV